MVRTGAAAQVDDVWVGAQRARERGGQLDAASSMAMWFAKLEPASVGVARRPLAHGHLLAPFAGVIVNAEKPRRDRLGQRRGRSIQLAMLILGSSRSGALSGYHQFFEGGQTYNAGLMQTSMVEIVKVSTMRSDTRYLETLVIVLDFVAFDT